MPIFCTSTSKPVSSGYCWEPKTPTRRLWSRLPREVPRPPTAKRFACCAGTASYLGDLRRGVRRGNRRGLLAGFAATARIGSGSDQHCRCDTAPVDSLLRTIHPSPGHPIGPTLVGLQAPGAGNPPSAALASADVGQVHRSGGAIAAAGAVAHPGTLRPASASGHALVHGIGVACLAGRNLEFSLSREPRP